MGRAIRMGWLAASVAVLTMVGSAAPGMAAIAPPTAGRRCRVDPAGRWRGCRRRPPGDRHVHRPGDEPCRGRAGHQSHCAEPHHGHLRMARAECRRMEAERLLAARTATSASQVHALSTGFGTGDAVIGTASISAHTFTVTQNGEVLRTMPASMGKPTRPTPIGNFAALSKERTVVMDSRTIGIPLESSEGYKITAQYAVRVTWGRCLRPFGAVVGGFAGLLERQPRLHQPQPGQRGVVLRHGPSRRPDQRGGLTDLHAGIHRLGPSLRLHGN